MQLTAFSKPIHSLKIRKFVQKVNVLKKSWTIHLCYNPRSLKNVSNSIQKWLKITRTNKIDFFLDHTKWKWNIKPCRQHLCIIIQVNTQNILTLSQVCGSKTIKIGWENLDSTFHGMLCLPLGKSRSLDGIHWQMPV